MIYYLDASVALNAVFPTPSCDRIAAWVETTTLVSSRLLHTEVIRALRREQSPLSQGRWLLDRVGFFDVTRATHNQAEAIERHTKTLDALHLATALTLPFEVTVATADANMSEVAVALGLKIINPGIET